MTHPSHASAPKPPEAAPPLWNPTAVALWSLLFTPIFGAWLHMKNWEALGEHEHANTSRNWAIGSLVTLLGLVVATIALYTSQVKPPTNMVMILLMLGWFMLNARPQIEFVKQRVGADYPRRGWLEPLLIALGLVVASSMAILAISLTFLSMGAFR